MLCDLLHNLPYGLSCFLQIGQNVLRQNIVRSAVINRNFITYINTAPAAVFFYFAAAKNLFGGIMEGTLHTVTIENCKKITATAIESVDAFSPAQIVLSYSGGRIIVAGSGLKISAFSKQSGAFCADGTVTGVRYAAKGVKLVRRIFK